MSTYQETNQLKGRMGMVLFIAAGVMFALSLIFALTQLGSQGHSAFNTSSTLPWGQPIASYLYFALASSGLGLLAALPLVFGFKQYYPIAKRCIYLSFVILISGMAILALEIGNVFRMMWALPLSFQTNSAMFWMGIFYALDLMFLFWKFTKLDQGEWDSKTSKQVGVASFLLVLLASGNLALIFGMMSMRPFWFDGLLPIYFYFTGATSGMAALVFFVYLAYGFSQANMSVPLRSLLNNSLPKLFAALIGGTLLFIAARAITGLYSNNPEIHVVWTDYMFSSWTYILSLVVGLLLPFVLLLQSSLRNRGDIHIIVSVLVFMGLFAERFYFVVGGQVVPLFKGSWYPNLLSYTPSVTEWALTGVGWSLALLLIILGERFLKLSAMPDSGYEQAQNTQHSTTLSGSVERLT